MNNELNKLLDEMEVLRKHLKLLLWEDACLKGLIPDGGQLEYTSFRALDALWNLRKELLVRITDLDSKD